VTANVRAFPATRQTAVCSVLTTPLTFVAAAVLRSRFLRGGNSDRLLLSSEFRVQSSELSRFILISVPLQLVRFIPSPNISISEIKPMLLTTFTLPSNLTATEFGKVAIANTGKELQVKLTILMEPQGQEAEGWQTGIALDASASMRGVYGRVLQGEIPPNLNAQYAKKGWIDYQVQDGNRTKLIQRQAYEDAIEKGHLKMSDNLMQPLARKFITYLAGNLDKNGGTTVIYWAAGTGNKIEVLGDFSEEQCQQLAVEGVKQTAFGNQTILLPAVKYFVERFPDAKRSMFIFLTDGKLNDLDAVKTYTRQLANAIASGKRNSVKCVLIGVGDEIDETQLSELDDLETGTNIDIWDRKIAKEMRSLVEIFAEVVDENRLVAPTGTLYDSSGNLIRKYTDGLPAKLEFNLPIHCSHFELEVAGQRIRQEIIFPK